MNRSNVQASTSSASLIKKSQYLNRLNLSLKQPFFHVNELTEKEMSASNFSTLEKGLTKSKLTLEEIKIMEVAIKEVFGLDLENFLFEQDFKISVAQLEGAFEQLTYIANSLKCLPTNHAMSLKELEKVGIALRKKNIQIILLLSTSQQEATKEKLKAILTSLNAIENSLYSKISVELITLPGVAKAINLTHLAMIVILIAFTITAILSQYKADEPSAKLVEKHELFFKIVAFIQAICTIASLLVNITYRFLDSARRQRFDILRVLLQMIKHLDNAIKSIILKTESNEIPNMLQIWQGPKETRVDLSNVFLPRTSYLEEV